MSAKLGTLTLDLVTKIGNFVGPIKESEKQVKTSFTGMKKDVLAYSAVAISGATAAGAAIFAMAKNYANATQELQTFAAISNATTQEFQAMSAGAETMNISQEKLGDQLKDFNEKLGEFITIGSGGAVDFFEQIATKTEGSAEGARKLALEMQNLSGPKALQLYVDKLEEAGVTQQQMSFYLESMASDTTNLIPLLKNGGEGFKYWADAAERYGLIMDESAIQKAAEFKVQLNLLDMQVQGAKNQFIQGLMPALVSIGDAMSDATGETNLLSDAGETLGNVFKGVAATGLGVYATIKLLSNSIAGLAIDATNAKKHMDVESGWKKYSGINFLKSVVLGTATSRTSEDSGLKMAAEDNAKVLEGVASQINKLFSDTTSQATKNMAKIQAGQKGVISGSDEWIKKQNEAANSTKAATDALKEQQVRARDSISYSYLDDFAKFSEDYKRQMIEIGKAGFGEDTSTYLAKAKARYDYEEEMYLRQITEEINSFKWSEEEKLKYSYETQRLMVEESGKYNQEIKELKLKAIDEQYALELRKAQWHALELRQTMDDAIKGLSSGADDIFAKATMTPQEYSQWSLENERSNAQVGLKNQRVGVERDIMTSEAYSTDDERYEALKQAHQEYRDALYAIDLQYDQQVKDLAQSQQNAQMDIWQDLLSRTGTIFSQMAEMVKETAGESSSAYKAMFLVNQGISVAQALINTEVAATKAMAEGGMIAGIPMSTAIRALGYASVGLIAGQTIAGMAHDGIDSVPREGTWLLDKGERVVDSRTNSDLKNYLAEGSRFKAPNVNVYTLPGQTADVVENNDGSLDVRIRKIAGEYLNGQLSNPNSQTSKTMKQNFNLTQKR